MTPTTTPRPGPLPAARLFVDGRFENAAERTRDILDPARGEVIATVAEASSPASASSA